MLSWKQKSTMAGGAGGRAAVSHEDRVPSRVPILGVRAPHRNRNTGLHSVRARGQPSFIVSQSGNASSVRGEEDRQTTGVDTGMQPWLWGRERPGQEGPCEPEAPIVQEGEAENG